MKYLLANLQPFNQMTRTLLVLLFISFSLGQTQLGADIDGEAAGDNSGFSISMNSAGDRVAIGAKNNNGSGTHAGHVRVYDLVNGSWTQVGEDIDGEAAGDNSGFSVSMNSAGDRVAIGAIFNDGNGGGAGHVRVFDLVNGSWTQVGEDIDGEAIENNSGYSVSMNSAGDRVAIGAIFNDGNGGAGHVRVYDLVNGSWTQVGEDIDGEAAGDNSGYSVSMNSAGERVAIGAYLNDGSGTNAGHVRVFDLVNGSWTQVGEDIDGEAAYDNSGYSVSMNSAGDRVAIGAIRNDGNANNAGHVRVYALVNGSWTQVGEDIDGEYFSDRSGNSVSMNSAGDRVVIGAYLNEGNDTNAGHVRVYALVNGSWTQVGEDIDGEAAGDNSGYSVSMNSAGDQVAIGAIFNDGNGGSAGHVRVFSISAESLDGYTFVPDDNFEQALIDLGYDDVLDNYVVTDNISGVTSLDVREKEISDLTGIAGFSALRSLYCFYNELTSLDVSANTALLYINCINNQLTTLDLSANTALLNLYCNNNQLTALDVSNNTALNGIGCSNNQLTALDVTSNTGLDYLNCGNNQLTALDVSANTTLYQLECDVNQLTALDVSNNTALRWFKFSSNQLTALDVNSNTSLEYLNCKNNQLTALDVSANTTLYQLECDVNQLTALDVSNNTSLTYLSCSTNQLTSLNMRNGVTDSLTTFQAIDNDLSCIETLDPDYATENWTNADGNIDEGVTFSVICGSENQDEWHVSTTGSDVTGNGTEESPFATIQMGINVAVNGNTIHVATGTYVENINFNGKNIPVIGEDRENTIIDGNQNGTVVEFNSGENSNALLDGFTIQNGLSNYSGVKIISSSPTLKNLIIQNNYSNDRGGGISISSGSPILSDIIIQDNYGNNAGGGISIWGWNSSPSMSNVLIINNTTAFNGNNNHGGGIHLYEGAMSLTNVTIANNSANGQGGGIYISNSTSSYLSNSIIWNNSPQEIAINESDSVSISYSDIQGGWDGDENIDEDPLFCDPENENYHLAENSPCLGSGENGTDMGALDVGCENILFPPVVDIPDVFMLEDSELYWDISEYINDEDSEELWVHVEHITEPMNEYVDAHIIGQDTLYMVAYDDWNGEGQIEIYVSDGENETSDHFTLEVRPVNDAPVFEHLEALVGVNMEFHVPIHVYDVDMDSLVVSFDESWDYPEWLSLVHDPHSLVGTPPEPLSIHFPLQLTDAEITITDTFYLSAQFFNPRITSVTDVPDDQGGRVYLSFLRSFFDDSNVTGQSYSFFRFDHFESDSSGWVALGSVDAIGDDQYTYEATTLHDSTSQGDGMTEFKVVASMNEGHFHSPPHSGYSLDNIAPEVPDGLMAAVLEEGIQLSWEMSDEEDFQYFILEKSVEDDFANPEAFEMIDTSYYDMEYILNEVNYYRLAAVDHAGNVSDYSEIVEAAVLSIDEEMIPDVYALHQNYPNPFNPTTALRYDLPEDARVSITIYDVMGRKVRSLINSEQSAGYRSIRWDATNDIGGPVSAGMYIYMIQAGKFSQTKKMLLLK